MSYKERINNQLRKAQMAAEEAENKVMQHYSERVDMYLTDSDFDDALEVIKDMPDCVSKVFLVDRIRHARGDFKEMK